MVPLEPGDVVAIAEHVCDSVSYDEEALRIALAGDEPGVAARAAAILHGLVRGRPFEHENERIAVLAALQFLAENGYDLHLHPPEAAREFVSRLAAGLISRSEAAEWIAARLDTKLEENPMFERFTQRARQSITLAQEEARLLHHNYIGTEHLLLGLLREEEGVAHKALALLGLNLEAARADVARIIGRGESQPVGHIPFTPRAKKVLELAQKESKKLRHHYIGTEHVLLGLVREGEGVACQVLHSRGADWPLVRAKVLDLLEGYKTAPPQKETVIGEIERLYAEVERLRGLLRRHGIDSETGAQTA